MPYSALGEVLGEAIAHSGDMLVVIGESLFRRRSPRAPVPVVGTRYRVTASVYLAGFPTTGGWRRGSFHATVAVGSIVRVEAVRRGFKPKVLVVVEGGTASEQQVVPASVRLVPGYRGYHLTVGASVLARWFEVIS